MAGPFDDLLADDAPAASAGLFDDLLADDAPPAPPSPATGARAAAEDAKGQRQTAEAVSGLKYASGVAQKAAQGITANWGDEIAATLGAVGAKLPWGSGKSRAEILRDIRGDEQRFTEQNPNTALAAEISGAVAGGVNAGSAAVRAAPWLLGRAPGIVRTAVGTGLISAPGGASNAVGRMEGELDPGEALAEAGKGAALAGGIGAVTGGAGQAIGNVVGPWVGPVARRLHELGVQLTPGEMLGGNLKRFEDIAASVPFAGALVRNRQAEGIESLNRAAYNEALAPLGRRYQQMFQRGDAEVGNESIADMTAILGRRYDTVVPRLRANFDQPLANDLLALRNGLPVSARPILQDAVRRYLRPVIDNVTGDIEGRGIQTAIQGLRNEGNRLLRSQADPYHYEAGEALLALRERLLDAAGRHSQPRDVNAFRNIDNAYARFAIVRDAASKVGADMGEFTPAQLHNAARTADRSAGKGATARGTGRMQNLSGPAKSVMTRRVSDSGTPERAALIGAILAPSAALKSAIPAAALAALYTRWGNAAFSRLGNAGYGTRLALRRAIQAAAPGASAGAGQGVSALAGSE
jgi:hypothetical protein